MNKKKPSLILQGAKDLSGFLQIDSTIEDSGATFSPSNTILGDDFSLPSERQVSVKMKEEVMKLSGVVEGLTPMKADLEKAQGELKKLEEDTNKITDFVDKKFEALQEEIIKLEDKLDTSSLRVVEVLTVFVSLITFISVDFALFRQGISTALLISLVSILAGCLFAFVLMIHTIIASWRMPQERSPLYQWLIKGLAILSAGLIFVPLTLIWNNFSLLDFPTQEEEQKLQLNQTLDFPEQLNFRIEPSNQIPLEVEKESL